MEAGEAHTGRFFVVSFPEPAPSDDTLYFIQDNLIGGIILFADHCRDYDSLKSWLGDLKKSLGYGLIVAVDQEGGRVRRFRHGFPMLEAPRYYGHRGRIEQYRSDLSRVCERLYEIGVNFNLVPTVDLLDSEDGHVLDTRTFSDSPDLVAEFARATIEIHHAQGLLCCAKHFPGLGRSAGDPHQTLAVSDLTEQEFYGRELRPFRDCISAGIDSVMVSHLSAPKVDEKPAIVSEKMIGGWLKDRLDFAGPVLTDDLLMEGALQAAATHAAVESFIAGADLLLFGQKLKQGREAFDIFKDCWQDGRIDQNRIDDASRRVNAFRQKIESL